MSDPSPNDAEQTYFPDEVFPLASKTISTSHYQRLPDTPNVCPTDDGVHVDVVSAIHQFCNADWSGDDFNDWAEDLATEILSVMPATPAAPGSSSPDVAALAVRLRAHASWDENPPFTPPKVFGDDCRAAADALEVLSARNADLESEITKMKEST